VAAIVKSFGTFFAFLVSCSPGAHWAWLHTYW
jgi:hypothetical protein